MRKHNEKDFFSSSSVHSEHSKRREFPLDISNIFSLSAYCIFFSFVLFYGMAIARLMHIIILFAKKIIMLMLLLRR